MTITTLAGVQANTQQTQYLCKAATGSISAFQWRSLMYLVGYPAAFSAPAPGVAGAALTSYAGQIPVPPPVAAQNIYLSRFSAQTVANTAFQCGTVLLVDRLWHNSGLDPTLATAQTVNSAAWPARDMDGSTNGRGVYLALEVTAAGMGAATPTITVTYTSSTGATGRTSTNVYTTLSGAVQGCWFPLSLNNGDVGVRSVQNLQLSTSWLSGTMSLVAYRPIAQVELLNAGRANACDAVHMGLPRLYDNSVPMLLFNPLNTTSTTQVAASFTYTQG